MATATRSEDQLEEVRISRPWISDTIRYILGENALIGSASLMLLVISGFATWSGMSDFIIGAEGSGGESVGKSIGGFEVTNDLVIVAIVIALTLLMWLALREAFGRNRKFRERFIMFPLYLFLALWSIGFGYGFWWSLIAGQEATKTSMAALREDARDATGAIAARLEAVKVQLDSVVTWSESQMAREEASGGSCGVASGAGRGPLYNARRSVRDSISSLRDNIVNSWITPVQRELDRLQEVATSANVGATVAERQAQFEGRASAIRSSARSIAARSNELGQSTASEMRALADAVSTKPGQPGFSCYDPTLAQRLRQAAEQAGEPAELKLRDATFNEGPAGVANAVKNLWINIGAGLNSTVYLVSGGMLGDKVGDLEGDPISGRDLIALLATIGVDLGLFALTALNPPPPPFRNIHAQARGHIRRAIERAMSSHVDINLEWIRKHFVHHRRKSYFVIPNVYSSSEDERVKALALNKLAGVFDDLGVMRWPFPEPRLFGGTERPATLVGRLINPAIGPSELKRLQDEERMESDTHLGAVRKEFVDKIADEDERKRIQGKIDVAPLRNHGLFSKAEAALESAGWSERARSDIEVFVLTDTEGLTPLLEVLNELRPTDPTQRPSHAVEPEQANA